MAQETQVRESKGEPQVAPGFRARELIVSIEISDDSSADEMLEAFLPWTFQVR